MRAELNKVRTLSDKFRACITGSAGLGIAERGKISFVQEVEAAYGAITKYYPDADAAVELAGTALALAASLPLMTAVLDMLARLL